MDAGPWKEYGKVRLPASDIPAPIRMADPNLRYQPLFELRRTDGERAVKLGPNGFSYHVLIKYCGWEQFRNELLVVYATLFEKLGGFTITRIGFRYVNTLLKSAHYVENMGSLRVTLSVADEPVSEPVNLNFIAERGDKHRCMVRIASKEFVMSPTGVPSDLAAFIDVDVYTPDNFTTSVKDEAISWTDEAHDFEKEQFFRLIPGPILDKLMEA